MQKVDRRKELRHLYGPPAGEVVEVHVPEMRFLMIDGEGDPNHGGFKAMLAALYSVSYALKFMVRERASVDYAVSPVEGVWWGDKVFRTLGEAEAWMRTAATRGSWKWTLMVMQPDLVSDDLFEEARDRVGEKKGPTTVAGLRLESFREGRAAQTLHRGPYAEEWPTIAGVHRFIEKRGETPRGKHHEIYLNDPTRTAPRNLKTVIRQPF